MAVSKQKAFEKKVRELVRQAGQMEDAAAKRAIKLLADARKEVAATVASTEWQAYRLPEMKAAVDRALTEFGRQYGIEMRDMQMEFWNHGVDLVDLPLRTVGVAAVIPEIDTTVLAILQDYSADLVTNLSRSAIDKINREITLGLMGNKSPYDVMEAVGRNLKDKSIFKTLRHRADTIVRTEAGRALEAAGQARKEAAARVVPGLQKMWIHKHGAKIPRLTHVLANGQVRNVDQAFDVGGEPLMYPRDPAGRDRKSVV